MKHGGWSITVGLLYGQWKSCSKENQWNNEGGWSPDSSRKPKVNRQTAGLWAQRGEEEATRRKLVKCTEDTIQEWNTFS